MAENKVSTVKYFFAGGFGGVCTVVVGHPMDTVKVRLQTMAQPKPGEPPLYRGTFDCLKKTVRHEGFRGLYKGMGAPLTGVSPMFALSFFGYAVGKKLQQTHAEERLTLVQLFGAGAFSGIFTTFLSAPGERIKCLLQVQHAGGPKLYDGPMDVIKKLYKSGGIPSIFRGFCATLLRDVPASGGYFMAYEGLKRAMAKDGETLSLSKTILAGGVAGILNWVIALPIDVLKSQYQTAPEGKFKNGIRSVFPHMMRTDGVRGLYRGAVPILLRAFPANAACFLGYEFAMKTMDYGEALLLG